MVTSRPFLLVAAAVSLGLAAAGCAAGRPTPSAGAPPLSLSAPDGTAIPVDELRAGRDATVLVFWSGGCPCVRRYQDRVDALLDRWPEARVRVVAVASNAGEPYAEALRVARERGVRVPLYGDPGGRLAEALGARSTPAVAVLDRGGALRFLGWIDNERAPGEPGREPWLDRAVDGLLAGRTDFSPRTPTWGCALTRSLFAPAPGSCCTVSPAERKAP